MVRRVGFGDEPEPPKKSVADRAMDRFRKKAELKRKAEATRASARTRSWTGIVFTLIWLILWLGINLTVGMSVLWGGTGDPMFLGIWLIITIFVAVQVTVRLIRKIIGEKQPHERPDNF